MNKKEMKFKDIAGMDCSGSKTYFPLFISVVHSSPQKINLVYEKFRELAIKQNPILAYRREIKAIDIKSPSTMKQIIDLANNLKIKILEVDRNFWYKLSKAYFQVYRWELKLNACLWFVCFNSLIKNELPKIVYLDKSYTKLRDERLFEYLLTYFSEIKFDKSPRFITAESKQEPFIKVPDIVAGILRKNREMRQKFFAGITKPNEKEVVEYFEQIERKE